MRSYQVLRDGFRRRESRLLAVLAAATLVVTACGGPTSGGGTDSASPVADGSAAAGAEQTGVTDLVAYTNGKSGAADQRLAPVTVGWVNQQGGALGYPTATSGAEAAVDYVNTYLGGINGHPLRLSTCFVTENEQEGNACGLKMVNNAEIPVVLYGTLLAGNQSFQAVNKGRKPILMANSISPPDATGANVFIFDGNPASIFGGLAAYAKSGLKAKTISVIYPQDAQSTNGVASLRSALNSVGIEMKAVGFDPSTTNLTAAAVAAGAQTADAVIPLVSAPPNCVSAAKALDSLSVRAPIVATGSFCFTDGVAKGLGGEAPKWRQLSTQANVADSSQADVLAYTDASARVGLSQDMRKNSDAALAWSTVMTAARFLNNAGGAEATAESVAQQAKSFTGPMLLGGTSIRCGAYPDAPGLCGAQSRVFEHVGGGRFTTVTGWLEPAGM